MFRVVKVKRPEATKPWLTQAQVRKVVDKGCAKALRGFLKWKTRALIQFLGWTSIRLSEAMQLKWSDIDFDRGYFVYRLKGGKQELYPIDDNIRRMLLEYGDRWGQWRRFSEKSRKKNSPPSPECEYVFPRRTGGKWWHPYESVVAAVGIEFIHIKYAIP